MKTGILIGTRGDPSSNLAEVSCLVADDGEFDLTMAHLEEAIAYVERNGGAGGAQFDQLLQLGILTKRGWHAKYDDEVSLGNMGLASSVHGSIFGICA